MAIREILCYPDERLKRQAVDVEQFDDALQSLIVDLEQTMRAGPGGVGIAAPQIGTPLRVVLVDVSGARKPVPNHGLMVLVNPEITQWDGMAIGREGCMSVPDYTGNVIRAERITLKALDAAANPQEFECEGFEARAVQHEMDHLDGMLFLDRLVSRNRDLFRRKFSKQK